MLKGWPVGGTRLRTVKDLQTVAGVKIGAGTEGTLLESLASGGEEQPRDIFVARLEGGTVMQVLREDVEEVAALA